MGLAQGTKLVLKNKDGQVVRYFNLEGSSFRIAKNLETKRIELLPATGKLEDHYSVLVPKVLLSSVVRRPYALTGLGTLEVVTEVEDSSPVYSFQQDNNNQFSHLFKWSAIVHIGLVVLILLSTGVAELIKDEPEEVIVEVFKQPKQIKKEKRRRVVAPAKKKIKKARRYAKTVKKKKRVKKSRALVAKKARKQRSTIAKNTKRNVRPQAKRRSKTRKRSLGQMGALGVLGGPNSNARGKSGMDIGRLKSGSVAGLGAGARGGVSRAVYNKGLVAVRSGGGIGSGSGARGGGSYNTRGKGGGRNGYGKKDLSGVSAAFSRPVTSEAVVEGGLSRSQIAAVIEKHMGEIVYCYEKGLQRKPGLSGRVGMKFVIGGRGRVTTARVAQTSLRNRTVENCMVGRLKTWQFPRPKGNVDVKVAYPFVLRRLN